MIVMFTGIVEDVGQLAGMTPRQGGSRLVIATSLPMEGFAPGDSLAVNGICLTVVDIGSGQVQVDAGEETHSRTTLGQWRPGRFLNLERAMRADGRFGGHFVSGHVDDVGRLTRLVPGGVQITVAFTVPQQLLHTIVPKGSIAIDGVSLTVAALRGSNVEVAMIPHTWEHTAFRHLRIQDRVNIETDMIGKYIVQTLSHRKG